MKRWSAMAIPAVLVCAVFLFRNPGVTADQPAAAPSPQPAPSPVVVPEIPFDAATDFLTYSADMNFGEVLGVAINSKNRLVVLNHPGSATQGPLYGNASTELLEFDLATGRFVREIGKKVYGLGYGHAIRFDRHDNLWVVDKGTNTAVRFNPEGYVTMNLGRRPEGPDDPEESWFHGRGGPPPPPAQDGYFRGPTDIAFDADDNIYISDGYTNARVAKYDKRGAWVTSWGTRGSGGPHADQNPGQFNTPHNIAVDRSNNVYVADRNNRRIQVFDADGTFRRFIFLNAVYDKTRHPVLGNLAASPPDETQPWTLCITSGATQYLYTSDSEPGRIYKMTLDGRILGTMGISGRDVKQFNWIHSLACPTDDTLYVADMNNWRIQKLTLHSPTR
ncbi:MAG: 6-bladed beta-propeller [Acidobacteria bacterium]|nr:6-bladed beta-propeller [Acidobacteriota bacterium]